MTSNVHPEENPPSSTVRRVLSGSQSIIQGHMIQVVGKESLPSAERQFMGHFSESIPAEHKPEYSAFSRWQQYTLADASASLRSLATSLGGRTDLLTILGAGSGLLVGTGFGTLAAADQAKEHAKRSLNPEEESKSDWLLLSGGSEVVMGLSLGAARGVNLGAYEAGVTTPTLASSSSLSLAAASFTGIANLVSLVWLYTVGKLCYTALCKISDFEQKIEKENGDVLTVLKTSLEVTPDSTWKILQETYEEAKRKGETDKEFINWCEEFLSLEAERVVKEYLESITPDPDIAYNFEEMAKILLKRKQEAWQEQGLIIQSRCENNGKGLTTKALIGLESLHARRIEVARKDLIECIGPKAFEIGIRLLSDTHSEEEKEGMCLEIVSELGAQKLQNRIFLGFAVFSAAVLVASTVGICVACPPVGLALACALVGFAVSSVVTIADIRETLKTWDAPLGKSDDRINFGKFLFGLTSIALIVGLSVGSMGTAPVVICLLAATCILVACAVRAYKSRMQKQAIREADISATELQALIQKIGAIDENKTKEIEELQKKIRRILDRKLNRLLPAVLSEIRKEEKENLKTEEFWEKRIVSTVTKKNFAQFAEDVKKWKAAEERVVAALDEELEELRELLKKEGKEEILPTVSFGDRLRQAFYGKPFLQKAFAEELQAQI